MHHLQKNSKEERKKKEEETENTVMKYNYIGGAEVGIIQECKAV